MYLLLFGGSCVAGYFFYRWRASVSLEKPHRNRQAKKHSLGKLWWGFLFLTTLPGLVCFWVALTWMWQWTIFNLLAAAFFGFAAGGALRLPSATAEFRARWPKDQDDEMGRPRSAA